MRSSTIFAAFAAVLMSGAAAIPVPAPAAVAAPEIEAREPQLLSSILGMPKDFPEELKKRLTVWLGGGSSKQSDSSQSGNKASGKAGNGSSEASTQ